MSILLSISRATSLAALFGMIAASSNFSASRITPPRLSVSLTDTTSSGGRDLFGIYRAATACIVKGIASTERMG